MSWELSTDAALNAQDHYGVTALIIASERGHAHVVDLLLNAGLYTTGLTSTEIWSYVH